MNTLKKLILITVVSVLLLGFSPQSVFAETNIKAKYVPLIGITSIPEPFAILSSEGQVEYKYAVRNFLVEGPLNDINVTDDKCSPVKFMGGDANKDNKLDFAEIWRYSCTIKLTETTKSIATARGTSHNLVARQEAHTTVIVGSLNIAPLVNIINITKIAYPLTLPSKGGSVTFTYRVSNPGLVPLSNLSVRDDKCNSISSKLGDTNANNLLDMHEVWIYTCTTNISKTTTNTTGVTAYANGLIAVGYATITTTVESPIPSFPETGGGPSVKIIIWEVLAAIIVALIIFFIAYRKLAIYKIHK